MSIRTGVIGVGYLGNYHAQNYRALSRVDLAGVFDTDQDRAAEIAGTYNTYAAGSLYDLLDRVDAVSIVSPTTLHHQLTLAALERGIHVLVEKPIASTLQEADEMIDMAARKNAVLQVGHIERFNPAFTAVRQAGVTPRFIEAHRLSPFNPRGTDVAVVLDLMIHDIDLVRCLVGRPVADIEAVGVAVISHTVDIANARLSFEGGCVANITASRISLNQMRKLRIFQENAYISVDLLGKEAERFELVAPDAKPSGPGLPVMELAGRQKNGIIYRQGHQAPDANPLRSELEAFIRSVTEGTPPAVTGEDGREALRTALAIIDKTR